MEVEYEVEDKVVAVIMDHARGDELAKGNHMQSRNSPQMLMMSLE
jgi:hypothetical protein